MARKKKEEPPEIAINDTVYLKSDPNQLPRQVVDIIVHYGDGKVRYKLACGRKQSKHREWELERKIEERPVIKGYNNK